MVLHGIYIQMYLMIQIMHFWATGKNRGTYKTKVTIVPSHFHGGH